MMKLATVSAGVKAGIRAMWAAWHPAASGRLPGEQGDRLSSDKALERMYREMWVDHERRALVALMREMDQKDGRVKQVHNRLARDCIRGGLVLQVVERHSSETLKQEWLAFMGRVQLDRREKLKSDARGLVMEGNLPLQLVFGDDMDVVAAVRMPSDTITPLTDLGGRFKNPERAYEQRDVMTGQVIGSWGAWQMAMSRLDPDNFDDFGSMGRPFLDACAEKWRQLVMTEEDLVIRRRMRAPLRLAHILEGASEDDLKTYRKDVEAEQGKITTDFFLNKKGGVQAVQGDAKLDDIDDVTHLLDTFYAGSPAPKGLFGYTGDLQRDILDDLKRDYYDEVDGLQDSLASGYELAFRMHLLFKGIDPAPGEFTLRYAQRRTETPNQLADLALKYMALGLPWEMIWADMGLDPDNVRQKLEEQVKRKDPYPLPDPKAGSGANVTVTPGNARKGESATSISNGWNDAGDSSAFRLAFDPNQPRVPSGEHGGEWTASGPVVARQMLEAMEEARKEGEQFGIRVLPSDHDTYSAIQKGMQLPVSHKWKNGEYTEAKLKGTSAIAIRDATEEGVIKALRLGGLTGKTGPNGYYVGDKVVLIRGERLGGGQDVGEGVFRNAVVVGVWKKRNDGLSPVIPN